MKTNNDSLDLDTTGRKEREPKKPVQNTKKAINVSDKKKKYYEEPKKPNTEGFIN